MNSEDFPDGGLSRDESLEVAVMLQEGGIDAIEMNGETFVSGKLTPSRMGIVHERKEAYFKEAAKAFKATDGQVLWL
jgi:2,4-dienoyl-CoA reductase-like NADH-dependent reductase (Old Yellow Enzyme family)